MMALGRNWAGKVYGTNTGNLYVKFEGDDNALQGTLHQNDPEAGFVVYRLTGSFNGGRLSVEGTPLTENKGLLLGHLKATAHLQPNGDLRGEWETNIGSAGTFVLFPHGSGEQPATHQPPVPDQVHTARYNFGPIEIERDDIINLADELQKGFKARVIVTFAKGTEQSRYLEDFKQLKLDMGRADFLKLFVREPDGTGMDKSITVEFGQSFNFAMTQSGNEAWVLGELEKLKRDIGKFQRVYSAKVFGGGINQIMLIAAIVFLPSLDSLRDRAILMVGVLALAYGVNWLHNNYVPHAAIYLSERKSGWFARFLPSMASWVIGIAASVIASLLAAYLKGWLPVPSP